MTCAANFAWANRQVIAHGIRQAIVRLFPHVEPDGARLVYNVAHHIAKIETYAGANCAFIAKEQLVRATALDAVERRAASLDSRSTARARAVTSRQSVGASMSPPAASASSPRARHP